MKTIAILSQKGGAGKTTLAINLAIASHLRKRDSGIIDLDPQASAYSWGTNRNLDTPPVVSSQAATLPKILENATNAEADLMIIDTSPHSQNSALEAARMADLILIPCRPAILDLRAIGMSIDIAGLAKKPVGVVLNAVPPRGTLNNQAREAIKSYGVQVVPVELCHRMAYAHSMTENLGVQEYEPRGKASDEIKRLYNWVYKQLNS